MTTNTAPASPPVRQDPRQVVNYISKTLNWNDANIGSGVAFANSIPAGAIILDVRVDVVTAFNAGTTNTVTIGTNASSYNNLASSADVTAGTAGGYIATRGCGASIAAAGDVTPFAIFTQTGAAATQGQAIATIAYTGGFVS